MFDLKYTAKESDIGRDVKHVLFNSLNLSNAQIKRLKAYPNGIMVNGKACTVRYVLNNGDILHLHTEESVSDSIVPVEMPLDIIYEDDYLLAVNKPINTPCHPSHGHYDDTLSNGVMAYYNKIGLHAGIHIVTRLDRNTSGVVLFAKDAHIHDLMSRKLRTLDEDKTPLVKGERATKWRGDSVETGHVSGEGIHLQKPSSIHKEYLALCEGAFEGSGVIDAPIAREQDSIITRCVREDGQRAITGYETVKTVGDNTLVRLKPQTGRTHQLRVHMAYIGHPIVGDDLYGAKRKNSYHHLHAYKLTFNHPITNELIQIIAENKNDWSDI